VQQIWFVREEIANANIAEGYCLKYDVSLKSDYYYKVVEETRAFIKNSTEFTQEEKDAIRTNGYGHVGDGNLHLNISIKGGYENKDL